MLTPEGYLGQRRRLAAILGASRSRTALAAAPRTRTEGRRREACAVGHGVLRSMSEATPEQTAPDEPTPAPAKDPLRPSRTSGAWFAVVGLAGLLLLLIIFIAQNTQDVQVSFLGWDGRAPLAVSLLVASLRRHPARGGGRIAANRPAAPPGTSRPELSPAPRAHGRAGSRTAAIAGGGRLNVLRRGTALVPLVGPRQRHCDRRTAADRVTHHQPNGAPHVVDHSRHRRHRRAGDLHPRSCAWRPKPPLSPPVSQDVPFPTIEAGVAGEPAEPRGVRGRTASSAPRRRLRRCRRSL